MIGRLMMISLLFGVTPFVTLFGSLSYYRDYARSFLESEIPEEFDFIVVGGGSAGAVVALRLSKNSKVLLLEAGGDPSPLNAIPLLAVDLLGHTSTDWMYETIPQRNACIGFQNQILQWPRGKVLGGSSTLNYMLYLRGHPVDYNLWANLTGDSGWAYKNLVPYFKKSILKYKGKFKENKKHYGDSEYGFLHVENRDWIPLFKEFTHAGKELLGLNEIDANGPQTSGFGEIEVTQNNGERWGTYASILKRVKQGHSLKISRYSQATKLELDGTKTVSGVWYLRHGKKRFARASKEVILSAGSINSPKILMLSGIGPTEHLMSVGIPPKVNLPVGKNLQDHVMNVLPPFILDDPVSFIPDRDMNFKVLWNYFIHGKGPLTAPNGIIGQAFLSSNQVKPSGVDWPDLQLYFTPIGIYKSLPEQFSRAARTKKGLIEALVEPYMGRDAVVTCVALVRPKSVGEIRLRNKNPLSSPIIDPRYLEHPDDVQTLIEGVKIAVKLMEDTSPFKKFNTTLSHVPVMGCESFRFRSDSYWDCAVRTLLTTVWHPVGTCRMGHSADPRSVVDPQLRVLKTRGLRVVDASIMPVIVNANTNAPTILLGEKGSDFIREHWSKQYRVCDLKSYLRQGKSRQCFYTRLI